MKEKAQQLIEKFYFALPNNGSFTGINNVNDRYEEAKRCALIAVDEIIKNFGTLTEGQTFYTESRAVKYYQEVKQEIEKI